MSARNDGRGEIVSILVESAARTARSFHRGVAR
jgi:hypothetical protein